MSEIETLEELEIYLEAIKFIASEEEVQKIRHEYNRSDFQVKKEMVERIKSLSAAALELRKPTKKLLKHSREEVNPLNRVLNKFGKTL